ncbi:hypothetical protein BC827DRAFT_1372966 [Russula dissimulans]|nr:hypothetical protein BC827DRAFT_1372966 [Russula dissimulans]
MAPLYQILLIAMHAASVALIAFPRVLLSPALARPTSRSSLSRSMVMPHVKERSVRVLKSKNSKAKSGVTHASHASPANDSYNHTHFTESHVPARAYGRSGDINIDSTVQDIDILNKYYLGAYDNAEMLKMYSSQAPASRQDTNKYYEKKCASQLTAFYTNSQGFTTTLRQLGAQKGLAHYDKDDPIEKPVKDMTNLGKQVLLYIINICDLVPHSCLVLGPIVYDIKCILDEILDAVENLTDAIIEDCKPSLKALVGEYSLMACKSGIDVAGICLGKGAVLRSSH